MNKNLINTANTAGAEVALGNTVPVGSIIRRAGDCIDATGSAINLLKPGYYLVNVAATFTAAVAGDVRLSLLSNGVAIPGATAAETITTPDTELRSVAFPAVIRVMCCDTASLSVEVSGTTAPTIDSMAITAVRIG